MDGVGGRRGQGERESVRENNIGTKGKKERAGRLASSVFYYGVAMVSRIDKIIGLFCRRLSLL